MLAVLVLLVAIVLGAWGLGAIDRLVYLLQVDSARTELIGQLAPSDRAADVGQADQDDESDLANVSDIVEAPEPGWYAYSQLSDDDREKYLILLDAFQSRESKAYPEDGIEDLSRLRECVIADHPELFYIGGVHVSTTTNTASGLVTSVMVEGQYLFADEEIAALQGQIDEEAGACLANMPDGDYEKAKYLYEYLAGSVEYDHTAASGGDGVLGASSGQTIADALAAHSSVCAGYARAYQYLLEQAGVPCVYVTGTARGGRHAWCAAFLDGSWYYIDPTWGDPEFLDEGGETADLGLVNYDYLCVTGDDISATHVPDSAYPLPTCTAVADNYYIREGLFLDDADVDAAGAIVESAVERGDRVARFRCANRDVYDQVVWALFDAQEIYRFIPGDTCTYMLGDAMCTVEVLLD